jgi:hypothetical protein
VTAKRQDGKNGATRPATAPVRRTEELSRFGSKGGKATAARMTSAQRKARAKKAIAARWAQRKAGK